MIKDKIEQVYNSVGMVGFLMGFEWRIFRIVLRTAYLKLKEVVNE
jgi:hypothetical protein